MAKQTTVQEDDEYGRRGVSSDKKEVYTAIRNVDKGIFPTGFCKIVPDIAGNPRYCFIQHADGAGTKSALAYIYWKETGDLSVWKGIAQDSIVMNLDDLMCVGAMGPFYLSGTIGRNAHRIPGEVIATIIEGTEEFLAMLRKMGIDISSTGGETADVGDLVKTIIVDNNVSTRMLRKDVILPNVQAGDFIVGLASFGQAIYEDEYNGGMGSNGLTSSRHDVFHSIYKEMFPETFSETTPQDLIYRGDYEVGDNIDYAYWNQHQHMDRWDRPENVGKLVLSPTRTYAPILFSILENVLRKHIHGIFHCSGGGQTKIMNFVQNVHIVKNNLFPLPPLFELIREEINRNSNQNARDIRKGMFKVFNMGHRMEIVVPSENLANEIIAISQSFNVDAQIIGRAEAYEGKHLTIVSETFNGPLTMEYPY